MSAKKKVLLLGDSHTFGTYGSPLEAIFKKAGWDATRVGWVGASAGNYLKGNYRTLKMGGAGDFEAAKADRYDLAIVTLGTNDAAAAGSKGAAEAAAKIKQVADQINASTLVWVGPPAFSDNAARTYNASFAKEDLNTRAAALWAAGSKLFKNAIDPRAATSGVTAQGDIHFDSAGGKKWAQFVFEKATKMGGIPWLAIFAVLPVGAFAAWLLLRKKPAAPAPLAPPALGAFTSNADLDKFKYRITKKQDGHVLRVYDGKKLIGAVGALTRYCDLPGYEEHGNVVTAEILPEYRGKKLYQEMLLRLRKHLKDMGCKGLKSEGFQRSGMATRAWEKLNPRVESDKLHPEDPRKKVFFLDGLPKKGRIPVETAKRAMKKLPKKTQACGFTPAELREGMEIEREHRDVTKGRVGTTAKIAASHLCEDRRYYKKLKKYVEKKGKS